MNARRACVLPGLVLMVSMAMLTENPHVRGAAAGGTSHPDFLPNGRIVSGSKSIWQKTDYGQLTLCIDGDSIGSFFEMFNFGKGDLSTVFFLDKKSEIADNHSIYTAHACDSTSSDVKLGVYRLDLSLRKDGLIQIESTCKLENPKVQTARYAILDLPAYLVLSGRYEKDGRTVAFDGKSPVSYGPEELDGATLSFFPENSHRSFSIRPVACSGITIGGSRVSFRADDHNALVLLLDLHAGEEQQEAAELSQNGIDFWSVDRLHLPDYGASTNLILNPSFEAGFRYWGFPIYAQNAIPLKFKNVYELDDQVHHSGNRSLRLRGLPIRSPSSLGPFAIPLVPGENYTYSFYARASVETGLRLNVWGRGQMPQLFPENVLAFNVGREWKRYSIPFVAKERFGSIYLDAQSNDGSEDGFVWVDDVQLEKGSLTDFTGPPLAAELLSAARGNFLKFGQNPQFKLNIRSAPQATGRVDISVEDFFFKTLFKQTYSFKADDTGGCSIALDDLSAMPGEKMLRGVCVVSAVFHIDGQERPYRDFFRFSMMDFLENKHKNKNLFNLTYVYSHQAGGPHMERSLERERAIGFGSICYDFIKFANDLDYDLDKQRVKLAESYGFEFMGRPVLKLHDGEGGEISEGMGAVVMRNIKNRINPTDQELAEFEAICELKAKRRPWNRIWWFTGESNPGVMPLESHPEAFAKFLLATARGIKRGNPDAKVLIEGGPWNMEPQYGGQWTQRYIQDTRRIDPTVKFDGAAAHHYRNFPENPDLDSDIAAFLAMLDRNGCGDWPFYVNEGGNYAPFNIPQEGMSPYIMHSANSWYIGPLSYDVGRAERISAAFSARNWLIGLKYAGRVACMQDFNTPSRTVDYDFTSRPYEKVPNTLGRLLGDATFYKDIRFAPFIRCYVFKDDKTGIPIAAIWGYKESVDRWKEPPPLYAFEFGSQNLKFVDLMENEVSYQTDDNGRTTIPVSSFPLFIIGRPGAEALLCAAIERAVPGEDEMEKPIAVSIYPQDNHQASAVFRNLADKELNGNAKVVINGRTTKLKLMLKPLGSDHQLISLSEQAGEGKRLPFTFSCAVNGSELQSASAAYMLLKLHEQNHAMATGDLRKWRQVSSNDLGAGLSARFALADDNLVIALEAAGENRPPEEVFAGLGLYIDPMGKTDDWTQPKTVRQDMAVFELTRSHEGRLEAFCHFVQGTQAGSGSYLIAGQIQDRIRVIPYRSPNGVSVTILIPHEVMAPLILRDGSRFGLNVSVPTRSEGWKTLAPIENHKKVDDPGELRLMMVILQK